MATPKTSQQEKNKEPKPKQAERPPKMQVFQLASFSNVSGWNGVYLSQHKQFLNTYYHFWFT